MNVTYPNQVLDRVNRVGLNRDRVMLGRKPLPPRPVSLTDGELTWEEPQQTGNITHYKIYLGGGVLFAKVPVGQTKVTGFTETKAFITSFDSRTQLESHELSITGTAASSNSIISVEEFGAIDDWNPVTELGTDNTVAIQNALDSLKQGQTLYFPTKHTGIYMISGALRIPPRPTLGLTIRGSDPQHCQILYIGTAVVPCVINMIGCDSITWVDISVIAWGADPTKFPKTILMLGRLSTDAYGHHDFHRVSFNGNVSVALVYSIASEENSWFGCNLFINNGKSLAGTAKHGYYTSVTDDLGICVPAVTAESNLDTWMCHMHIFNFSQDDSDADCIYIQMAPGSGDHVYRDIIMAPSIITGTHGFGFRFVSDPIAPFSGSNYVVTCVRQEHGEGMFHLGRNGVGPGIITGLRFKDNTLGISAGQLIYAENGTTISQSTWENNFPVSPSGAVNVSIDLAERLRVIEDYDQTFTVRTSSFNSYYNLSCATAVLSIASGANNVIILNNHFTMNGPVTMDATNAIDNPTIPIKVGNPGDRSMLFYGSVGDGVAIGYHYDSVTPLKFGFINTTNNDSTFSIGANDIQLYASSGAHLVGQVLRIHLEAALNTLFGKNQILSDDLTLPMLLLVDKSGVTTGNAFQMQTNGGTVYFQIRGGTDASFPGTVQCRAILPFTDDTYDLGGLGLEWKKLWVKEGIDLNGESIVMGTGSPEGVIAAGQGSIFLDTGGNLWIKVTGGTGNTGWLPTATGTNFWTLVTTGLIRTNNQVGINRNPSVDLDVNGDAEVHGNIINDVLTASEPVFTSALKKLVSQKIDLNATNHVDVAAFASGMAPISDGTRFVAYNLANLDTRVATLEGESLNARITAIENALAAGFTGTKSAFPLSVTNGLVQP